MNGPFWKISANASCLQKTLGKTWSPRSECLLCPHRFRSMVVDGCICGRTSAPSIARAAWDRRLAGRIPDFANVAILRIAAVRTGRSESRQCARLASSIRSTSLRKCGQHRCVARSEGWTPIPSDRTRLRSKCLGALRKTSCEYNNLQKFHQKSAVNRFREFGPQRTDFRNLPPAAVNSQTRKPL